MKKAYLAILLFFIIFATHAGVYKTVDKNGNVVFSDIQAKGAKQVKIRETTTYQAPTFNQQATGTSPSESTESNDDQAVKDNPNFRYKSLKITNPLDGETLFRNEGSNNVEVAYSIDPLLQEGHTLVLRLNGEKQESLSLQDLPRGAYQFQLEIVDDTGRIREKSNLVKIRVHQPSAIFNKQPAAAPNIQKGINKGEGIKNNRNRN